MGTASRAPLVSGALSTTAVTTSTSPTTRRWSAKIVRAEELAAARPEAEDLLRFYVLLASWQRDVAEVLEASLPQPAGGVGSAVPRAEYPLLHLDELDPSLLTPHLDGFVRVLAQGPPMLVAFARGLEGGASLPGRITRACVAGELSVLAEDEDLPLEVTEFAGQSVWQPFLELLGNRAGARIDLASWYEPVCPFCGGPPLCSCLEGTGARSGQRLLVCALCLFEWPVARLRCPECRADDRGAFSPVESEDYPAVRLDICSRCHCYLKTVDARQNGHVVAAVDDIATPALDLWAGSQGLHRPAPALVR